MRDTVVFEPLAPDVQIPARSTRASAGYDVRAYLRRGPVKMYRCAENGMVSEAPEETGDGPRIVLQPGDRALVPTGFKARLPSGFEAQIRMRSSLAWKRGLIVPNAPGTVDADYPDEWFVLVLNASPDPVTIDHGERIAQIVLNRYEVAEWKVGAVAISTDRVGGLGSTGAT
ncbi:MAG: dUTP diphosphatase [Gemmatimonadota bacterium]